MQHILFALPYILSQTIHNILHKWFNLEQSLFRLCQEIRHTQIYKQYILCMSIIVILTD